MLASVPVSLRRRRADGTKFTHLKVRGTQILVAGSRLSVTLFSMFKGCLEQLSFLIKKYGLFITIPAPALKDIAKQISDRDNAVRNAALNCIVDVYFVKGEEIRQTIGQVSGKGVREWVLRLSP